MGLFELAVIFVIAWWIVFFIVLPIGVRGQYEDGDVIPGTEEAAPTNPALKKKAIWATMGAVGVTVTAFAAYNLFLAGL